MKPGLSNSIFSSSYPVFMNAVTPLKQKKLRLFYLLWKIQPMMTTLGISSVVVQMTCTVVVGVGVVIVGANVDVVGAGEVVVGVAWDRRSCRFLSWCGRCCYHCCSGRMCGC